ncbi:hypothetical protein NMY22_g17448 [Coprinellus aureogranulatus]|nr:hypothetical protein NMY22_g17448 [Coprinellus aureogranulatus]
MLPCGVPEDPGSCHDQSDKLRRVGFHLVVFHQDVPSPRFPLRPFSGSSPSTPSSKHTVCVIPFAPQPGSVISYMSAMNVGEALNLDMEEERIRGENVFIFGEDIARYNGAYKIIQGLMDKFGERRVVDKPITDKGIAGIAVGAAFQGLHMLAFPNRMLIADALFTSVATGKTYYMSGGNVPCPVVFRGPNVGAAASVAAQHSQDYAAWYISIPGLKIVSPWSGDDCKGLLKNEMLYGVSFPMSQETMSADFLLPIGKAKVEREGSDLTIVAHSKIVTDSLESAEKLAKEGIMAEVINLRSIRPLDIDTIIKSVKKTNRLVVIEGGFLMFSVGSEICAQIVESEAFDYLDAPVECVTGADVPTPYATNLEALAFLDTPLITKVAK